MNVDLCDIRRQFRAYFFAGDRDVSLQANRFFFTGSGKKIEDDCLYPPDPGIILMFGGAVVDIPSPWQLADGTNGTVDLTGMFVVGAGGGTYSPGDTGGADIVDISHTHGAGTLANSTTGGHNHGAATGGGTDHTHGPGSYTTDTEAVHSHSIGSDGDHFHGLAGPAPDIPNTGASYPASTDTDGAHDHGASTGDAGSHSHSVTGGASAIETAHTHSISWFANHTHTISNSTASGGDTTHDNRPAYYSLCFVMRPSA